MECYMFTIEIKGYGRETFAGKITKEAYDFFKENHIDMNEYAKEVNYTYGREEESELGIPKQYDFGAEGLHQINDLWAAWGPFLSDESMISITDEDFDEILSTTLDELEDSGIKVVKIFDYDECMESLTEPTFIMQGHRPLEEIYYLNQDVDADYFDPSKLTIYYGDYDGLEIVTKVEYDGEELTEGRDGSEMVGEEDDQYYCLFQGYDEPEDE